MKDILITQIPGSRVWLVGLLLLLLCALGVASGRAVKTHKSYLSSWGQSGRIVTVGGLMAVALGGGSIIGSAQVAYVYGFDAVWFGFGMALGVTLLMVILVKPTRDRGGVTANGLISQHFGARIGQTAAIVSSLCVIPSAVSQMSSAGILINFIFQIPTTLAVSIGGIIMLCVVLLGGLKGAELIGIIKTAVFLVILPTCVAIIAFGFDGFPLIDQTLPHDVYYDFFSRGVLRNICNGVGIGTGMLAVQANFLPLLAARSEKVAKQSCMITAAAMVIAALCGCAIGMFMRCVAPALDPSKAFLTFVLNYLPPVVGEMVIAVLFITVASSGASLFLGISTAFMRDVLGKRLRDTSEEKKLKLSRILVLLPLLVCYLLTLAGEGMMIVDWSFISSALRSSCFLLPLLLSVYQRRSVTSPRHAALAIVLGPVAALGGYLMGWEALPSGLLISALILLAGLRKAPHPRDHLEEATHCGHSSPQ